MKPYTFRLTDEMMERIQQEADAWGTTPSDIIRKLIAYALEEV